MQANMPPPMPKRPYATKAKLISMPMATAKVVPDTAANSPAIMMLSAITIPLRMQADFLCLSFVPHLILHVLETMPEESLIIH